jgi:hypothetical protein
MAVGGTIYHAVSLSRDIQNGTSPIYPGSSSISCQYSNLLIWALKSPTPMWEKRLFRLKVIPKVQGVVPGRIERVDGATSGATSGPNR